MGLDSPPRIEPDRTPAPGLPLGRTNEVFPATWLSLRIAQAEPGSQVDLGALVEASLQQQTVVDISVHPALFGGFIRGSSYHDDALLMGQGGLEIERAPDAKTASDLVQAHLIESLSAVGREHLDFYFLKLRSPLEEYQIDGALQALEMAKQEGHIRFLGLSSEGQVELPTLGVWQFHDAFDVLLSPARHNGLINLATQRRVGVVIKGEDGPANTIRLVPVRSPEEVRMLSASHDV